VDEVKLTDEERDLLGDVLDSLEYAASHEWVSGPADRPRPDFLRFVGLADCDGDLVGSVEADDLASFAKFVRKLLVDTA